MVRFLLLLALLSSPVFAENAAPLYFEVEVSTDIDSAWNAWTTQSGVNSFFAPQSVIEPRVDGEYTILFNPNAVTGEKGAEGMRILAFEPPKRLLITWNGPPSIPYTRNQNALVEVRLESIGPDKTRVHLKHFGFGSHPDWSKNRDYFENAWPVVLKRLTTRFDQGPIDWSDG